MGKGLKLLVGLVSVLLILQAALIIKVTDDLVAQSTNIQAQAGYGSVGLCINNPPTLSIDCDPMINQSTAILDNTYVCQLNATLDANETANYTYQQIIQNGLNFSVNSSGALSIWANHTGVGLYFGIVYVQDGPECPLEGGDTYIFEIVDINDPPHLRFNMPSKQMREGTTLTYGFLSNYFGDIDGDSLTYSFSPPENFIIVILPNSEVRIVNPAANCESEYIYFTANDGALSTDGNMIYLESVCDTPQASTGGGGGGLGCEPEWKCQRWSQCYPNGTRSRECIDLNGCDLDNLKREFWEACDYQETCFDGIQNQDEIGVDCGGVCPICPIEPTCFDGIKNQGEENVDCGGPCILCNETYTCFDGLKNQGETGVDCGGPCEPCKEIQIPGLVDDSGNDLLIASIIAFLVLVAFTLGYMIFRKDIRNIVAKIRWLATRKKRKQYLLDNEGKKTMLEAIRKLEDEIGMNSREVFKSNEKIILLALNVARLYYEKVFGLDHEFTDSEMEEKAEKLIVHASLKAILLSFFKKVLVLERTRTEVSKIHLTYFAQELKELVISTSHYMKEDVFVAQKNYDIKGSPLEMIVRTLHNSMIDLQFGETDIAKEKYAQVLALYEKLSEKEKSLVYEDITRLFNHIRYVIAWNLL